MKKKKLAKIAFSLSLYVTFGLLAHDIELSTKKGRGVLNAKTRPF